MTKYSHFNIIKHRGTPNSVTLATGYVARKPTDGKIYAPALVNNPETQDGWFPCADYDNHFIFALPESEAKKIGIYHMCSCGSQAVLTDPKGFYWGSSSKSLMFVCYLHTATSLQGKGQHADGSS